ncbi:MAG: hypothetical protein JXA67_08945, partial [Micromonosporaceae bacterium]|nr:hypothetical protein [Micromonosporaceae bacterium]
EVPTATTPGPPPKISMILLPAQHSEAGTIIHKRRSRHERRVNPTTDSDLNNRRHSALGN